jgi:hypothetical protein
VGPLQALVDSKRRIEKKRLSTQLGRACPRTGEARNTMPDPFQCAQCVYPEVKP